MALQDTVTKQYMSKGEIFADAFNYLIYSGRQVIRPDQLSEMDTTQIAIPFAPQEQGKPETTQKYRDVLKTLSVKKDKTCTYLVLGIENQSRVHYAMPIRNMLYDVLAVPNIGIEFYLGNNWTIGGNVMYGWWNSRSDKRYWRIYGGDIAVRKWFGRKAEEKPLTGHHLGLYGQIFTYDFEWGGKGYMGGKPGETLWESPNYAFGVEYGYSLPIARRLNIDFTLGVGYWGGKYYTYNPRDGHFVWQSTRNRHWFGPTKAEISLVWLLGRGNSNNTKGGMK